MSPDNLRLYSEIGFPILLLLAVFALVKRVWSDLWPWVTDSYWPARIEQERLESERVEKSFQRLSDQYMEALKQCQVDSTERSTKEHAEIISALRVLIAEVKAWRSESINLLALFTPEEERRATP